jgi:hypothetical protein
MWLCSQETFLVHAADYPSERYTDRVGAKRDRLARDILNTGLIEHLVF